MYLIYASQCFFLSTAYSCNKNVFFFSNWLYFLQIEMMQQNKVKAEIQALAAISPDFLTSVYLPNKLRYGGWL